MNFVSRATNPKQNDKSTNPVTLDAILAKTFPNNDFSSAYSYSGAHYHIPRLHMESDGPLRGNPKSRNEDTPETIALLEKIQGIRKEIITSELLNRVPGFAGIDATSRSKQEGRLAMATDHYLRQEFGFEAGKCAEQLVSKDIKAIKESINQLLGDAPDRSAAALGDTAQSI